MAHNYSWAGPIMWYSYKDRGDSTSDTEDWFGLVGPNGEHKMAYDTYQNIATQDGGTQSGTLAAEASAPALAATEQATFTGVSYTGDQGANTIIGNDLNNTISGGGGDDTIKGGSGNDKLWGGSGDDIFNFSDISSMGRDTIMDFQKGDKIDLSGIDADSNVSGAQDFNFIGSSWLAKAGDLGFYQDKTNGMTHIQGDTNGDGKYDLSIVVQGVHTFAASDFIF